MSIQSGFDLPERMLLGLAKGDLERVGSVIKFAKGLKQAGQVVAWLREVTAMDQAPRVLVQGLPGGGLLGMCSGVSSVLSLGATVAFGASILSRLGAPANQDDSDRLSALPWTVDFAFRRTYDLLNEITKARNEIIEVLEHGVFAEAKAAAELAWTAQQLEPNSRVKDLRIENALAKATSSVTSLESMADKYVSRFLDEGKVLSGRARLAELNEFRHAVRRLRQLCLVGSLHARLLAEQGQLDEARERCRGVADRCRILLNSVAIAMLRRDDKVFIYDDLLSATFRRTISADQVGRLAARFDPQCPNGLPDVLEFLRKTKNNTPIEENFSTPFTSYADVGAAFNALEGAAEDLDRLDGIGSEYEVAKSDFGALDKYRDALSVQETSEDRRLVIFHRG